MKICSYAKFYKIKFMYNVVLQVFYIIGKHNFILYKRFRQKISCMQNNCNSKKGRRYGEKEKEK